MTEINAVEWDLVNARVLQKRGDSSIATASISFLQIVLSEFFPDLGGDFSEIITDGSNDRGVDAIHIVEGTDSAEIYIFQSKYRESLKSCSKTINDSDLHKVRVFLEDLFEKSDELRQCANFGLREAVLRIWGAHEEGKICRYNIVFCSNGSGFSESASSIVRSIETRYPNVTIDYFGGKQLVNDIFLSAPKKENGILRVISNEIFERTDGDIRGVVASVEAASFIDLIKNPDGSGVKKHIFDENLRVFLGAKGGYNTSIISTASADETRHLFWYLNNGITITCKNFSYNKGHSSPTIRLNDFQIVNGAQTSHSLIEASRLVDSDLHNVVLMIKIFATDRKDITEKVAVATNSQARIQSRDLRVNQPILRALEESFLIRGYFFERKRNMHADKPSKKRIDALKMGQIILSFDLEEPDKARTESDTIFDDRFRTIFHEGVNVDRLVKLFELYSIIENFRDIFVEENGSRPESGDNNRYLVYGHWFVLYACRLILKCNNKSDIPTGDSAKSLVRDAIQKVANACKQNKSVAHYQVFRSPKTKDKIMAEIFAKQADFFDLLRT
ncbi:AIPR family protein [Rhodospira trueperi]|nr:AIPR family protein [Rhodospira trueperi]